MKISLLILKLEELREKHGNLEVRYTDNYEGGTCDINRVVPSYPYKIGEWGVEDKTQPADQIELI